MQYRFTQTILHSRRHIRKKSLRCVLDGLLYVCMVAALLFPLLIWGYYAVSGHVLSATIVLTLFQTNGSESLAYLKSQNLFVWGGNIRSAYLYPHRFRERAVSPKNAFRQLS